jgi:hypothetical protein
MNKIEKATTIALILTLIIVLTLCNRYYNREEEAILKNLEYLEAYGESSKGIIIGKTYSKGGRIRTLMYNYYVEGKEMEGRFRMSNIDPMKTRFREVRDVVNNCEKGDFFLVLYDKKNPENSFLMLNCPIKTRNDLIMYRSKYGKESLKTKTKKNN